MKKTGIPPYQQENRQDQKLIIIWIRNFRFYRQVWVRAPCLYHDRATLDRDFDLDPVLDRDLSRFPAPTRLCHRSKFIPCLQVLWRWWSVSEIGCKILPARKAGLETTRRIYQSRYETNPEILQRLVRENSKMVTEIKIIIHYRLLKSGRV